MVDVRSTLTLNPDGRLFRVLMAVLGRAETGPYEPAVPPPTPRPRDNRGLLLTPRRRARLEKILARAERIRVRRSTSPPTNGD